MVESFVDGDDSIGHGTGYGTSHHNGDLQGIIDSLDYIESLGVNAIWLTPIFEAEPIPGQDHWADRLDATGYFSTDYFKVDPRFGDLEKAKELVEEAHKRGLYVFLDGVFGHHKKGLIKPSPTGKLPSGSNNPVDYPESLDFYKEVATYWIKELKIDGWRLDQAYQVPTAAWTEIRKAVDETSKSVTYTNSEGESVNPLGYMVAEIWNNENTIAAKGYGSEKAPALCSSFDFPVRYSVVETLAVNENGVGEKPASWLNETMSLHSLYPNFAQPNLMLGNHDLVRFGDLLQRGQIANPEDPEYWLRHKAAFAFQAAYTGPITLYYGDEIGDQVDKFAGKTDQNTCAVRGLCDDHVARSSAKIEGLNTELNSEQKTLKEYVQSLMKLRAGHPAMYQGKRTNIIADEFIYVDHKQDSSESILFVLNTGTKGAEAKISTAESGSAGTLIDLLTGEKFVPSSGEYHISLEGLQSRFLSIAEPIATGPVVKGSAVAATSAVGFEAQCDNPNSTEAGPISRQLYVVGDFQDSQWKHVPKREYQYKGNNVYQAVVDEKRGRYKMQYASSIWKPQFTAKGLSMKLGESKRLVFGGYGKDTAVMIPEDGKYVWSLTFDDAGKPKSVMVSKCQ
ncbi:alpha-amylase family glycosyl hydrolase [Vibrio sp. HN007]